MANGIRVFRWLVAALAVVCTLPCASLASQFLSAEIEAALTARSEFQKRLDLEDDFFSRSSRLSEDDAGAVREKLGALRRSGSPWYHYISGLVGGEDNRDAAERFFSAAVEAAGEDPGALWLLAVEFIRNGETSFADECLDAIKMYILASGGSSAPLLSQQLILLGNVFGAGNPSAAEFCYAAARRFDENQCWWLYKKGAIDFPKNIVATVPDFVSEAGGLFATSWRAQIALLSGAYRFFAATLFIFVCAVFVVFAVKYLPQGVHRIGDTLFMGASPRVRTAVSVAIVLAITIIGIVPTLWAIAFLVCRFMNASEKKLLIFACAALVFSPLGFLAQSFLNRGVNPGSSAVLLDRSIREGYSADLYGLVKANLSQDPDNLATRLALAVSATKSGDRKVSAAAVNKVLELAPNDYLALIYAGNYSFLIGDTDGMERYYGAALKNNPRSAAAKYNLAQAYINSAGFTASDMVNEAAKLDAPLIGGHTRANARYFQDDVPPLRQIINPALTPSYFWSRLFAATPEELLRFNGGKRYFGLTPLAAFGASAGLMTLFLLIYSAMWKREPRIKKYFTCRICGRLLCRSCRKGTMCSVCYKKNIDSHNNAAAMYNLQKANQDMAVLRTNIIKFVLGSVFPGAGGLYKGETLSKPIAAMLITSAVYAAVYCAATFHTCYPSQAVINPLPCVSILLLYNVIAVAKQCAWFAATMKSRRDKR